MSMIYVVVSKPADYGQVPYEVEYHGPEDSDVTIEFVSDGMSIAEEVARKVDLRNGYVVEIHAKILNSDNGFTAITLVKGWWEKKQQKKTKKRKI